MFLILFQTDSFSFDSDAGGNESTLDALEYLLAAFFTVELLLRTFSQHTLSQLLGSGYWWIDAVSVFPFYVDVLITGISERDVHGTVATFRVLRVLRLLKILRYYRDFDVFFKALSRSAEALLVRRERGSPRIDYSMAE